MSDKSRSSPVLRRPDIYVGLMFIGVAALGLYLARNYPMGTAVRMGTGYVPVLLCWTMMALGCIVLLMGMFTRVSEAEELGSKDVSVLRPLFFVSAATVVFAFTIESLGLIVSLIATMAVGSLATPTLRWIESIIAMAILTVVCWAVFSVGLGLPFPVWPRL